MKAAEVEFMDREMESLTEELQAIAAKYFRMIVLDPYDLTIQSKCTGHYGSYAISHF